jgi:hypothetical protein
MDEEIVSNICVWRQPEHPQEAGEEAVDKPYRSGRDKFRHRKRGKS